MVLAKNIHFSFSRCSNRANQPWELAHLSLNCFMHVKIKCVLVGSSHLWFSYHSYLLDILTPGFLEFFPCPTCLAKHTMSGSKKNLVSTFPLPLTAFCLSPFISFLWDFPVVDNDKILTLLLLLSECQSYLSEKRLDQQWVLWGESELKHPGLMHRETQNEGLLCWTTPLVMQFWWCFKPASVI